MHPEIVDIQKPDLEIRDFDQYTFDVRMIYNILQAGTSHRGGTCIWEKVFRN